MNNKLNILTALLIILILLFCSNPTSTDNKPPVITIISPINGSMVSDNVIINLDVSDNEGIDKVEIFIDEKKEYVITSKPWEFLWDSYEHADNKTHLILAKAYDNSGNSSSSEPISVTVIPPINVNIISPDSGATVKDTVNIIVEAQHSRNFNISKIELLIDGEKKFTNSNTPWKFKWDTYGYTDNQEHYLEAKAIDETGKYALSKPTIVIVKSSLVVWPTYLDFGTNITQMIFRIVNNYSGTHFNKRTYSIIEDMDWISVYPTDGSSKGEIDEIIVMVDRSGLSSGHYEGEINVIESNDINNPVKVKVRAIVQ
ncbi:MAG: hypothetical protein GF353_05755 [Candidatus Lokiarchaeota archaeon]|nr:hypothetical protein [Candidatus Lokiarchaeota archaeon]